MFLKLVFVGVVIMFATTTVSAVNSTAEFAEKFEAVFRIQTVVWNMKLADIKMDYFRKFIEILGPNFKYAANLQEYYDAFDSFKYDLVGNYNNEELVNRIVGMRKYAELDEVDQWMRDAGVLNPDLKRADAGLAKHDSDLKQARHEYFRILGLVWCGLYKTLPAAVKDEHTEYKEINDIFMEMQNEKDVKLPHFASAMKLTIKAFGYKYWDLLM